VPRRDSTSFFDRLRERARAPKADDSTGVEAVLRETFHFLEEHQGFELAQAMTLPDGAVAAWENRPAGRAIAVFARRDRGAWAGVTRLEQGEPLPPVNRDTVKRGIWRELRRVDVDAERDLAAALADLASALGGRRAA
jgi:hypothetical protein